MTARSTRRRFLGQAAAAGGGLALAGFRPLAHAVPGGTAPASAAAPLLVVTRAVSADVNPRGPTWIYIREILNRAGVFFEELPAERLPSLARRGKAVVVLAGNLPLAAAERDALAEWVKRGGAVVGIGGTSGLDELFGVTAASPLADGWMKVTAADHPVTAGLRSSLHVFGGYAVKSGTGNALAALDGNRLAAGRAIQENRFGQGQAILLAPDLIFSIVHIQQGFSVLQDGKPSADESAPVNDGVLKAEDGMVLDWQRDRVSPQPDGFPVFLEPVADELREIILRSIFHAAGQAGVALAMLWYWPRALKAVGHISHDTDGNIPPKAVALLEVMNRCKLKSTWCTIYPGGYPREFYSDLKDQGFEIALHYDAMTGKPESSWSKDNFMLQHRWLMNEAGLKHLTTNKNHYTRWEGRLQLFRWCEEAGIESDQTRGPSKKGTVGFPLGGSQPYYPLDDEAERPRLFNVLEVDLLTQDLVVFCPPEYGHPLLDSALRHHGVAHFLFHPNHILKTGVAEALADLVDYGRAQGLEWWTNRQIVEWETLRRGVEARFDAPGRLTLRAARPLREATLLVLKPAGAQRPAALDGRPARSEPWRVYGFEFDAIPLDLAGAVSVQVG